MNWCLSMLRLKTTAKHKTRDKLFDAWIDSTNPASKDFSVGIFTIAPERSSGRVKLGPRGDLRPVKEFP
jgi:hypothetical protein